MSSFDFKMTIALISWPILVATMDRPTLVRIWGIGLLVFGIAALTDIVEFFLRKR